MSVSPTLRSFTHGERVATLVETADDELPSVGVAQLHQVGLEHPKLGLAAQVQMATVEGVHPNQMPHSVEFAVVGSVHVAAGEQQREGRCHQCDDMSCLHFLLLLNNPLFATVN